MSRTTESVDLSRQGHSARFHAGEVEYIAIGQGDGSILLLAHKAKFDVRPEAMNSIRLIPRSGETYTQFAKRIAAEYGITLSDDEAGSLLWEKTGFPEFWATDDPVAEMEAQLRATFDKAKP